MNRLRICAAVLVASASLGLAGCATDGYGYGGSYYSGGLAYGGDPYYGWYDDYYYPGTGYYVYDRGGRRHAWNDGQRHYWEGRRGHDWHGRENWSGMRGDRQANRGSNYTPEQRQQWRAQRDGQMGQRRAFRAQPRGEMMHGFRQGGGPGGMRSAPPQRGNR